MNWRAGWGLRYSLWGFDPSTFVYSRFPPRIQFLYYLLSSVAPCKLKGKVWNLSLQMARNGIFLGLFQEFQSFMGSFEEKLTRKIHTTTFLYECLWVSKPKSKKNRSIEWKIVQGCFKNKKTKEIEFHNSFKDYVFTTVYRLKIVLGKMLACFLAARNQLTAGEVKERQSIEYMSQLNTCRTCHSKNKGRNLDC